MKTDNVHFVTDPKLAARIREYVGSQGKGQNLDANSVSDALQRKFPEYARKKRKPFVNAVQKVLVRIESKAEYGQVKRKRKSVSEPASPRPRDNDDESFSSDNANYASYPDNNLVNSSLMSLYKNGAPTTKSQGEKKPKRQKRDKNVQSAIAKSIPDLELNIEQPKQTFSDIGGFDAQLLEICKLCMHLKHPKLYDALGVRPPRGFLLHGPPGCGKTLLAHAIAGELELPLVKMAAPELISGVSGESENKIRQLFGRVTEFAPCVLFLDEIDAITPKRENAQREMERRIVAQIIACLDELEASSSGENSAHLLVIGATSRLDALDPALRRAGRFDKEIGLGIPDEAGREKIMNVLCRDLKLDTEISYKQLARLTPGYVGADLNSLVREASMCALDRIVSVCGPSPSTTLPTDLERLLEFLKSDSWIPSDSLSSLCITMNDFGLALKSVHPSAKREGFATVPDVSWSDVGALASVRDELEWSILYPIKRPEAFEAFNLCSRAQGILLCGPPGCGKTLLAKAVANESAMNFISVKGPELLSMYVGESERAVRQVFQRARNSVPCVIFFDEIDALCPKRSDTESGGSVRVVNQLLTEMDGLESRKQVFIMGATNRPDIVDPAIMRPGRLDKMLYVGFPTQTDRMDIIRALTKGGTKPKFGQDVDLELICGDDYTAWFSGADLAALVREASVAALKEMLQNQQVDGMEGIVSQKHLLSALQKVHPSVSPEDRKRYESLGVLC